MDAEVLPAVGEAKSRSYILDIESYHMGIFCSEFSYSVDFKLWHSDFWNHLFKWVRETPVSIDPGLQNIKTNLHVSIPAFGSRKLKYASWPNMLATTSQFVEDRQYRMDNILESMKIYLTLHLYADIVLTPKHGYRFCIPHSVQEAQ